MKDKKIRAKATFTFESEVDLTSLTKESIFIDGIGRAELEEN